MAAPRGNDAVVVAQNESKAVGLTLAASAGSSHMTSQNCAADK